MLQAFHESLQTDSGTAVGSLVFLPLWQEGPTSQALLSLFKPRCQSFFLSKCGTIPLSWGRGLPALSVSFRPSSASWDKYFCGVKRDRVGRETVVSWEERKGLCAWPPSPLILPPLGWDPSSPSPDPSRAPGPRLSDELHPLYVSLQMIPGEMQGSADPNNKHVQSPYPRPSANCFSSINSFNSHNSTRCPE